MVNNFELNDKGEMSQKSVTFQAIKWEVAESDEGVTIYIHGLNRQNKRVTVKIPDFKPYVYLELDPKIKWTEARLELLRAFLRKSLHINFPAKNRLVERKKNYYYKSGKFLWMAFNTTIGIRALERAVRGQFTLYGVGTIHLKVHEQRASPILKLFAMRKIKPAGWIVAKRTKKQQLLEEYNDTFSSADIEMVSSFSDISVAKGVSHVTNPLIVSYDIECVSGDATGNTFPNPTRRTDQIICISATVANFQDEETEWKSYALVNEIDGKICPHKLEDGAEVRHFKNEKALLLGWTDFINEIDPDVITGYNTLSFDDNYMSERANARLCWPKFSKMGRLIGQRSKTEERRWSSSAYGDQRFNFIDIPGRLHIDMYPVIFKDYGNLMSYTLDYVSEYFLDDHKIDLPAKEMIQKWHRGEEDDIREIVTYCNKDTWLPLKLMKKLNTWLGLTEMSNVMMVPIFDLITRGQQIRMFSQVYCLCFDLGVVCTERWTDYHPTDDEKKLAGATVQDPMTGYHELVATYDFCLAGNTQVSLSNGTSKRIDEMYDDYNVLGYDNLGFRGYAMVGGLQEKGAKDTVNLTLQYGNTITCTPDHQLLTSDRRWVKAQQLKGSEIICGIEYPQDTTCPLEENWSLHVGDREFNLLSNRDETLAFCRLLGYILADGSIYTSNNRKCVEIYFGTFFDANTVHADLELLTNVKVTTRLRKGNNCQDSDRKGHTYCITLAANLAKLVHQLDGIVIGKRATQAMYLPKFIVDPQCPLAVLREFLGGLFGGDGIIPSLSDNTFTMVSFKWTTTEKYLEEMSALFEQLENLLSRFNISCGKISRTKVKYTNHSIKPVDYQENPRYNYLLRINKNSCYDFVNKIGFRYCINKAYKAYIVALYYNYCNLVRKQHKTVIDRANKLFKGGDDRSCKNSLEIAREEFLENNVPLHEFVLSSVKDLNYMRGEEKRRTNHRISIRYKKNFPKPHDFLNDLGIKDWFNPGAYIMRHDSVVLPSFKQKIVNVKSAGIQNVYDIQVDDCHNFVANGIVAHNCSLYPTTIIAYNLCFSTFVPPDENPPEDQYHDLRFAVHFGCLHDTAVRKTKVPKAKIICGEYHYRFYKATVKKGIVPMLLEHLLEARANTRKEIAVLAKRLKEEGLSDAEEKQIKLMIGVLDKRQLGYKTASNSMYGGYGSDFSYTPFYPAAQSTTAMGRKSIKDAIDFAKEYRPDTILVYGDSVTQDTPVLLRNPAGQVTIQQISLLAAEQEWDVYRDFKPSFTEPINSSIEYHVAEDGGEALLAARHMFNSNKRWSKERKVLEGWQVWTDSGWSPIKQVIRHKTVKKIYRVTTHTGTVDVTQDHSLLSDTGEQIKPVNLKIGDQLLHNYPYNSTRQIYFTSGPSNKLDAAEEWLRRKRAGYETYIRHEAGAVILYYDGLSRKNAEIISIRCLGTADDYVYDLETESGRFQAGIGEMIVKNTDSCMLKFSNVHKLKECFELCKEMEKVINAIFPKPMYLELEKIYSKYFLLSKKRYVGYIVDLEGNIIEIDKKGVVIKRRDNCAYLREIYSQIIDMVMAKEPRWKMFEYLRVKIDDLLKGNVDLEKLVITKSIKDTYKTQNLPHVAVAQKMRDRGKYVASGTRIRYIFTKTEKHNDPQYIKADDPDHYLQNQDTMQIDYLYYFEKQLVNPLDEVLKVKFNIENVLKNLLRLIKKGIIQNATQYFHPKFKIEN
uniref:DNA polymerase n=2 Tax=root TaxID=1 RepID=A0A481YY74_9VIRU|nr:MAG: DNA polymerase elongation subunit family B [Marseillevirus LCMAC202]